MRRTTLALLPLLLVPLACGGREPPPPQAGAPAPAPVRARTEVAALTPLTTEVEMLGTVRARETVNLSSKLMGTVTELNVKVGDRVAKDQVVAVVDSRDASAMVEKAKAGEAEAQAALAELERADAAAEAGIKASEANLALARSTYNRFKGLSERGSVSRQEFEEVEARYKAAEAQTEQARRARESLSGRRGQILAKKEQARADGEGVKALLAYSRIVSPISGVVVAKQGDAGTLAVPGVPLLSVEEEGRYRLEVQADESALAKLRRGDRARVRIDALGIELGGAVDEFEPSVDPTSRTVTVKLALDGQRSLRSGLFGRAFFAGEEVKALLIPRSALVERGQLTGVYAVDRQGAARLSLIKTGRAIGGKVEVLAGLNPGERLVVESVPGLTDGARVE